MKIHRIAPLVIFLLATFLASGQTPGTAPIDSIRPNYILGPNDQILIRATEMEEISERPFTVGADGMIELPRLGRVQAGGRSIRELEEDLVQRLRPFVKTPQVNVTVVQFRTDPVFFVGAFQRPGIYNLLGRRTLVEMLTTIGGLQPNASRRIKITRRAEVGKIPLNNAVEDPVSGVSSVEISMGSLTQNVNPAEDIILEPYDVISVERAESVYVSGALGKVGAFELGERDSISVTQILALAGGLTPNANEKGARILRPVLTSARRAEIPLDLKRIMKGEINDFPLRPNDVLYIPTNKTHPVWSKLGYVAIGIVPALVVTLIR